MKGAYAKIVWTHKNYGGFRRAFEEASREALIEAGEIGVQIAKHEESRHIRTGATQRGIGYAFVGKGIAFFVRTLQGVFIEYGTKQREGPRGRVEADPYLRPAMIAAGRLVPGFVRRRMTGSSLFLHRVGPLAGRVQTRASSGRFSELP